MEIELYLKEAARLFQDMDAAYDEIAAGYGFQCRGCADNCCRSLFYHHTLVEFLWLRTGLDLLPRSDVVRIRVRAQEAAAGGDAPVDRESMDGGRPLCPLNSDGRCRIYIHRPMICRLHGIPHLLQGPGGHGRIGPGCDAFNRQVKPGDPLTARLDRTPWYMAMARLENRLRLQLGYRLKIKMTIAQMILEEPQQFEIPN